MPAPLVSINEAGESELTRLYGIGPKLARRIVAYRQANGFFTTADDLARVEGLSAELAGTLAPHIDWRVPQAPAAWEKEREWGRTLHYTLFILMGLSYITLILLRVTWSWDFFGGELSLLLREPILSLIMTVSTTAFLGLRIAGSLTREKTREKRLNRAAFLCVIPMVLTTVGVATFNAIRTYNVILELNAIGLSLLAFGGQGLLHNPTVMVFIPASLMYVLTLLALVWRPALAYSNVRDLVVDFGLSLQLLSVFVFNWVTFWDEGISLYISAMVFAQTALVIASLNPFSRRSGSVYFQLVGVLLPSPVSRQKADTSTWMSWLNNRLPDPEQQKQLRQAMDNANPPSRTRTLINLIVFGAGGWLLITSLGAIVEWAVQRWLGNVIP